MRNTPLQILFLVAALALGAPPAPAQAPAHPDSVEVATPHVFDGTGASAWGPIPADPDTTRFRPVHPGLSAWEYPVAGLWWLVKLPFSLLNTGARGVVHVWGDIPFYETIARWVGRFPDFGAKFHAEWTPTSGTGYGVRFYENRPFHGRMHLQYAFSAGGRGDLAHLGAVRLDLREGTELDLVGSYHRRGAERYFGPGPDSDRDDESFFTSRHVWFGTSLREALPRSFAVETRAFYTELRNGGPRESWEYDGTADVFGADLPRGWDETTTGMSYEFELRHDRTGTPGRGVNGGLQRLMVGYFRPTSGPGVDLLHYRFNAEQFIGGRGPAGRQLALKFFWSWLDSGDGAVHFQRLLTNHEADAFRGFHDFRFRDRGITGLTVEYRYPVWDYGQVGGRLGMDGYVFWDAGQVFGDHSSIRLEELTHSLGIGLRLASTEDFLVRAELAGSREDLIARLSVSQVFQRAKGGMFHGRVPVPMR